MELNIKLAEVLRGIEDSAKGTPSEQDVKDCSVIWMSTPTV